MLQMIRVAVVDDHPLFREGVMQTLGASPELTLVGAGANSDDAIRLVRDEQPNVILLDIQLPGGGIEAARTISTQYSATKVIMLTASEDESHVSASLEAGARGYALKGIGGAELVRLVRVIQNGETYITPDLAARMLRNINKRTQAQKTEKDLFTLTPREDDILDCVAVGLTNKEIAIKLNLAEKTVKHYMTTIMQKLQVRNRVEAALKARKEMHGS